MKKHIAFIFLIYSCQSFACRPSWPETDELIENSKGIYGGYIVGVALNAFEEMRRKEPLVTDFEPIIYPEHKTYSIAILETLKGEKIDSYDFKWESCGNGLPELREKVILYRYKHYNLVLPFDLAVYKKLNANKSLQPTADASAE